jgi:cobalt-zinc-cadmium efflux system outer membrane protein
LVRLALENRQDLQAAIQSKTLGEKMVRLVRASRAPEIELETGLSYSTIANNEIAPSPAHYAFTLGISMPIKTSGLNRGELSAAQLAVKQLEMQYRDAALAITAEVTKAYIDYQATRQQLEEFHAGLLADADKILASRIYSYQRGETGFLDVLTAQRTYQEVRRSFYETHYACLAALIELERAAGIWDLTTGVGD